MRFCLLAFHIYTQLTNIKLQNQFFTTVTLEQFCFNKSPAFNITSLITVQQACNNTEVLNTLHAVLIHKLLTPCNRVTTGSSTPHSVVTASECVAQYIHSLFINLTHSAHLTQLISSDSFSKISPLLKQFHSSRLLPIARHYSITLCTDIRSCRRGSTMIQFCLLCHQITLPTLIKTQY